MTSTQERRADRSEGISYQELLTNDSRPVSKCLTTVGCEDIGPMQLQTAWYLDRAYHELEKEHIWKKVWQFACRVEELPEVGDTVIYDICDISIILVRVSPTEVKAYYNSCLHRGRALLDHDGRVNHLQCPFHGFTWNLDGSLKKIPCEWDFAHIRRDEFSLPAVRVGIWGGFVFINMDKDAEPLGQFLGELDDHFSGWRYDDRRMLVRASKVIPTNWKAVQDAFNEAFHSVTTHPQVLPGLADANAHYDAFDNFSRMIAASGVPSPHLSQPVTAQDSVNAVIGEWDDQSPPAIQVPEGVDARTMLAMVARETLRPAIGDTVDSISDAEMVDTISYQVFPNFKPFGGFLTGLTYRVRPYGDDHNKSIFDVYLLPVVDTNAPIAPPKTVFLSEEQSWMEVEPYLGTLAPVFNQDTRNLDNMTKGLRNSQSSHLILGKYQELAIRHFFHLWTKWLGVQE